jgi:Tfp pilus assembly protein PilX
MTELAEVSVDTRIRNYRLVLAFSTLLFVLLVSLSLQRLDQVNAQLDAERITVSKLTAENKLSVSKAAGDLQFCEKRIETLATGLNSLQEKLAATERGYKIASAKCNETVASLNTQLGKTAQAVVVVKKERDVVVAQQKAAVIPQSSVWAWVKSFSPWQR